MKRHKNALRGLRPPAARQTLNPLQNETPARSMAVRGKAETGFSAPLVPGGGWGMPGQTGLPVMDDGDAFLDTLLDDASSGGLDGLQEELAMALDEEPPRDFAAGGLSRYGSPLAENPQTGAHPGHAQMPVAGTPVTGMPVAGMPVAGATVSLPPDLSLNAVADIFSSTPLSPAPSASLAPAPFARPDLWREPAPEEEDPRYARLMRFLRGPGQV